MFTPKHLIHVLVGLLTASCAAPIHRSNYRSHLTQAQAVRLARSLPYPKGWDRHLYAYRGNAFFIEPTHQWVVSFEMPPGRSVPIGADYFCICIDDATGKFDHYDFAD